MRAPASARVHRLAWLGIGIVIALAVSHSLLASRRTSSEPSSRLHLAQARLAIGIYHVLGAPPGLGEFLLNELVQQSSDAQVEVAAAVAAGELLGTSQAVARLQRITGNHHAALEVLNRMISADEREAATPAGEGGNALQSKIDTEEALLGKLSLLADCYERKIGTDNAEIKRAWGWIGELAAVHGLSRDDPLRAAVLLPAERIALSYLGAIALVIIGLVTGLCMLVVAVKKLAAKTLQLAPRPADGDPACLVAFAVYLLAYICFGAVAQVIPVSSFNATWFFLPVVALVLWLPVGEYGWNWRELRTATGMHAGKGVFREIGCGLIGYVAGLPILAVGFMMTVFLVRWFPVDHPLSNQIIGNNAGLPDMLAFFALASIFAPVVEELMFRGLLYHHLRRHGQVIAVLGSALIFAVIHPQGIAGIPVIAAIGVVFALLRTWRGSLIASVTAHALHNGAQLTVLMIVMG